MSGLQSVTLLPTVAVGDIAYAPSVTLLLPLDTVGDIAYRMLERGHSDQDRTGGSANQLPARHCTGTTRDHIPPLLYK